MEAYKGHPVEVLRPELSHTKLILLCSLPIHGKSHPLRARAGLTGYTGGICFDMKEKSIHPISEHSTPCPVSTPLHILCMNQEQAPSDTPQRPPVSLG